jgi:hypothetical protein
MERIKALSTGTKLGLVAGVALFLNLSLTWQRVEVDFGPAGRAERLLDGWDAWGLLIGVAALALAVLTVLVHLTDVELRPEIRWERVTLSLAALVFLMTLVKNLTDAGSTLASYVGLGLAALVLIGAFLDVRQMRSERSSATVGPDAYGGR